MKSTPLVSVVMSVFNGEKYLRESIDSVLNQTFSEFEFIIINDGSTDDTLNIIKSYKDPRIVAITQKNQGIVGALSKGIDLAKSEYIARMDADDICMPHRLKDQFDYMEQNNKCVLLGGNLVFIDSLGKEVLKSPMLLHDPEIRLELMVRSPFAHPAVMFRKSAYFASGGYDSATFPAEDYDLWVRMAQQGELANVDSELLAYRLNDEGISATNNTDQIANTTLISEKARQQYDWGRMPNYRKLSQKYSDSSEYRNIQLGRLTDVYMILFRETLSYNKSRALRLLRSFLGSLTGVVAGIKWTKRKIFSS